ncbi:50S ribosomal protein L36 [Crocosphaera watsonii WH 8501]
MSEKCRFIRQRGRVRGLCTNPKHKNRQG